MERRWTDENASERKIDSTENERKQKNRWMGEYGRNIW